MIHQKNFKDRLHFFKIKNSCSEKDTINEEWKNKVQTGENICKSHVQWRICIQNMLKTKKKTSKTKQRKETTQLKMGKRLEQTLHQKGHTNGYK